MQNVIANKEKAGEIPLFSCFWKLHSLNYTKSSICIMNIVGVRRMSQTILGELERDSSTLNYPLPRPVFYKKHTSFFVAICSQTINLS
jgi:hypothetical protein